MSQYFCSPLISCRCLRAAGLDVQSDQDFVYPCFASLPMGFSWALWAAQRCHEKLVVQAGLSDSRRLQDGTVPADLATGAVHFEYVDNLVVMGLDKDEVNAQLRAAKQALLDAGLFPHEVEEARATAEVLGVVIDGELGVVNLSDKRYWKI